MADSGLGEPFFALVRRIPAGDKFGHFFLMGMLSFLVNISLNASKIRVFFLDILKGSFIIWILVTLEEISQVFLQFRSFSFIDLLCDYCGIFCFGKIAACYLKNKN
ncbi:MAG: trypsin [Desulfobacterales bacterium]|nr:trypsin [Desulfobacterales bacterium]